MNPIPTLKPKPVKFQLLEGCNICGAQGAVTKTVPYCTKGCHQRKICKNGCTFRCACGTPLKIDSGLYFDIVQCCYCQSYGFTGAEINTVDRHQKLLQSLDLQPSEIEIYRVGRAQDIICEFFLKTVPYESIQGRTIAAAITSPFLTFEWPTLQKKPRISSETKFL